MQCRAQSRDGPITKRNEAKSPVSTGIVNLLRGYRVNRTLVFEVLDRTFIVAYGTEVPTEEEWRIYLDAVKRHGIDRTMQLIYTEGGGPSAKQRRSLDALLCGRSVPVAVLSDNVELRGMIAALSWFNHRIRAFPTADLEGAVAFLEIPSSRTELIERVVIKLRRLLVEPLVRDGRT
jgi:hypothetical protein